MPATKALFFVVILAAIVLSIVFTFFEDYRPGIVQNWIDQANGFTPAQSPNEAFEKFRDCIRKRNYKTAVKYVAGDYKEYFSMGAAPATKLADGVDDLKYNVNEVVHLNSPDANYVLDCLQPFPKDFEFTVEKPIPDQKYKILSQLFPSEFPANEIKVLGQSCGLGVITFKINAPGEAKSGRMNFGSFEPKAFLFLVPLSSIIPQGIKWDGIVALKEEGNGKDKGWKIHFPLTPDVKLKVDYMKASYGNYVQAIKNVKYAIKHDAASKNEFESELTKYLTESK
jgi:hypothetical protein